VTAATTNDIKPDDLQEIGAIPHHPPYDVADLFEVPPAT
jgi:hypothetical protein